MFYLNQFESFDPIAGHVPEYPLPYLSEIAQRARALLGNKLPDQIERMAKRVANEIDDFFSNALESEIYRLQTDLAPGDDEFEEYFEWDGGTLANGRWFFKDAKADELGIPTEENTSEVDALKMVITKRDGCFFEAIEAEPLEYSEGKDYELFSVVALWLLAESIQYQKGQSRNGQVIAGNIAIKAMDAVCYAEHLKETKFLVSVIKNRSDQELREALDRQKTEQRKWIKHCLDVSRERDAKKKSEQARYLNIARHRERNEAQARAIEEWKNDTARFPSAEKAGLYLADWLGKQGFQYEPRTVTGWVRSYAKEIGVKFR